MADRPPRINKKFQGRKNQQDADQCRNLESLGARNQHNTYNDKNDPFNFLLHFFCLFLGYSAAARPEQIFFFRNFYEDIR